MPVKKEKKPAAAKKVAVKKKTARRTTPKNRQGKKEMRKAIKEIPELILKEVGRDTATEYAPMPAPAPAAARTAEHLARTYRSPERGRRLMWIGVSVFTIMVLFIWGLNITAALSGARLVGEEEAALLSKSGQDLQDIFNAQQEAVGTDRGIPAIDSRKEQDAQDAVKEALKATLLPAVYTATDTE